MYNYPKDIKSFYMKQNDDGRTVQAMDVLVPGVRCSAALRTPCAWQCLIRGACDCRVDRLASSWVARLARTRWRSLSGG